MIKFIEEKKKPIILIALALVIAGAAAYFYLTKYYFEPENEFRTYTAEDFPQALEKMTQEILDKSLIDLNVQYQKLREGDRIYVRWINIGLLKKRLKDYPGAEAAWLKAIDYNPDLTLAYSNLADLYLFDLADYQKAEEYYLKVIDMKTDSYSSYHGLASLYRYNLTEKASQIEEVMLKGVENSPTDAGNYYMYLSHYFNEEGNDKAKAKDYAQKTLEANPELKDQLPDF